MIFACVAGLLFVVLGLWWIVRASSRPLRLPGSLAFSGLPLCCIALLSLPQVVSRESALWGLGYELDTVGAVVLGALIILIGSLLSRKTGVVVLVGYLALSSFVSAAGTLLFLTAPDVLLGVAWMPPWYYFPFLAAVSLSAAVMWYGEGRSKFDPFLFLIGGLSMFTLLFLPHSPAGAMGLVALGILAPLKLLLHPPAARGRLLIAFALAMVVCVVACYMPALRALPGDLRPSPQTSMLALGSLYVDALPALLVGHGPNTFAEVWNLYRPAVLNSSAYWDVTPESAYSTLFTLAATLGVLGVVCFVLIPFSVIAALVGRLQQVSHAVLPGPVWASVAIVLSIASGALFFVVSTPLFIIEAVFVGVCARFLYPGAPPPPPKGFFIRLVLYAPLCVAGAFYAWVGWHQTTAAYYHALGAQALAAGSPSAEQLLQRAADAWPQAPYEQDVARAILTSTYNAGSGSLSEEQIKNSLALTRIYAERARNSDPANFEALLSNAAVYVSLVIAGATDAAPDAQSMLSQAEGLSPTRPEPYRLYAEMYYALGDYLQARENAEKALQLKPDYAEALALKAKIDAIIGS